MTEKETPIDPEVVRLQLLSKLVKYQENMIQEGVVEALKPRTINMQGLVVHPPYRNKPWFSVKIINDGDNSVYATVNTGLSLPAEIKGGEMGGFDFSTALITDIGLKTNTGTSIVRIRGVR